MLNSLNVNWIKLTDFIDILKLATTTTGYSGQNSGGDIDPILTEGYYLIDPIITDSSVPFDNWSRKGIFTPRYI